MELLWLKLAVLRWRIQMSLFDDGLTGEEELGEDGVEERREYERV